jgi:hypothetical protein
MQYEELADPPGQCHQQPWDCRDHFAFSDTDADKMAVFFRSMSPTMSVTVPTRPLTVIILLKPSLNASQEHSRAAFAWRGPSIGAKLI